MNENPSPFRRVFRYSLWALAFVGVIVGSWRASRLLIPQPAVGVIKVNTDIWATGTDYDFGSTELFQAEIDMARTDPRIKAVVVQFDSPGGEVVASQSLFLELQALRRGKPVVGSINTMAASGAYYAVLATEPVYARPSSYVGNIGVWGYTPANPILDDSILASGPFKLTGSNRETFLREIEEIKKEFLATVVSQRGDRLQITPTEISQGLIYSGRDALRLGLVDKIGSQTDAIAEAARQAGIAHYEVLDLEQQIVDTYMQSSSWFLKWDGAADPMSGERTLPPGIYMLYNVRLRGAE